MSSRLSPALGPEKGVPLTGSQSFGVQPLQPGGDSDEIIAGAQLALAVT